jgi:chromosomal replication initiation ATPase DnaA
MLSFRISTDDYNNSPIIASILSSCLYEVKDGKTVIYGNNFSISMLKKKISKVQKFIGDLGLPENIEFCEQKNVNRSDNITEAKVVYKLDNKVIPNVDNNYTFENFFIDETNNLACTMAKNIANESIKLGIPIVTFLGPTGVGKTHLACAILNVFKKKDRNEYAYFFKKNTFHKLILDSFVSNQYLQVIRHICNAKYVVFDDLVFISELPAVFVKAIYDIIDERMHLNLVTIFTSPTPLEDIVIRDKNILEEESPYFEVVGNRIKYSKPFLSRLKSNIRYIDLPTFKLKFAFFKKALLYNGIDLSDFDSSIIEKIEYLVAQIEGDFRMVQNFVDSFLNYYLAYSDIETVVDILFSKFTGVENNSKTARIRFIINKLNEILDVNIEEIFSKGRLSDKYELLVSNVVVYTLYKICNFKQILIAEVLGIHRTNIVKKVKAFEKNIEKEEYKRLYERILKCDIIK